MIAPSYIHLKKQKNNILTEWEKRCRSQIQFAADSSQQILCCDTEAFLDEMAINLKNLDPKLSDREKEVVIRHSKERARMQGFTLNDLLREFGILRQVLIEFLHAPFEMTEAELKVFNSLIDAAMETAGYEFAKSERTNIQQALNLAEKSNQALEHFASIVAHDFRSPLATLSGFTELLEEEISTRSIQSREVEQTLKRMKSSIGRAIDLVDGLLTYSRLGTQKPDFTAVNLNEVVQAAWENLKHEANRKKAHLYTENLPTVQGAFPFLTQLFQNLFSNSLKFCKDNVPEIRVSVTEKDADWVFEVHDNGIGFNEEDKEAIFQLHQRLKSDVPGNGIGLSTCRKVLDMHHGHIWAHGHPGEGASFYFTLPKVHLA